MAPLFRLSAVPRIERLVDNPPGVRRRFLPAAAAFQRDPLQVVEGIDESTVDVLDRPVDVGGHRDVQQTASASADAL